jgi:predicted nuclease of restriction endonuclease-like (RecB) superfamily
MLNIQTAEYKTFIKSIKERVREVQIKASVQVNSVLLEFYWELGNEIIQKQKKSSWGSGFLKQISKDLMIEFPEIKGFSLANLQYIRRWVLFYFKSGTACATIKKEDKLLIITIPWGHNRVIISKCNNDIEALYYVKQTLEYGWSRSILTHQIESRLYEREGKALTNFSKTLPSPQSDLANQILKDPYNFDFLTMTKDFKERELENALLENITKFLLELGAGFAFIGRQKHIQVGEQDFYIDLLFYHTQLHCYVVVELKTVDFQPEFAGKLNFYIKAVDMQIKNDKDEPTIGILLCKGKDKTIVEYSLSDIHKPMGVSEYELTHIVPNELKSALPSIEDISEELGLG